MSNCIVSFSGGKDSILALHKIKELGYKPKVLVMWSLACGISYRHCIETPFIKAYEDALGIPVISINLDRESDNKIAIEALKQLKEKYNADTFVTGDINGKRAIKTQKLLAKESNLKIFLPLCDKKTIDCTLEAIDLGYKCLIKSIANEKIPTEYLGKQLNLNMIEDLKNLDVDPSGEDNSYHTMVYDGPVFIHPLSLKTGDVVACGEKRMIKTYLI